MNMSSSSFSSPWASNLDAFTKILSTIPADYRSSFEKVSNDSLGIICNKSYLHIWETDSDIDSLLQLTQVIVKVREMSTYVPSLSGAGKSVPVGMIILVEQKGGRNNFARVCELVKHLTGENGRAHLNNSVFGFGGIKVVKGMDNSHAPDRQGRYARDVDSEARKVVERVNKAIERIFKSGAHPEKKIVWHHGPVVHFLNFWIAQSKASSSLAAVTVHSALAITSSSITPSPTGRQNKLEDLQRLERNCKRLDVFAVFTDAGSQLIEHDYLINYMYYYAYYLKVFIPWVITLPHLYIAQDQLVTYCFRLRAACEKKYDTAAVKSVQRHLEYSKAKVWAKQCINPANYENEKCKAMARDSEIRNAVYLADSPFATFSPSLPAFSRLTLGPAASLIVEHYTCAPISLSLSTPTLKIRAANPSPFRLWLPKPENAYRGGWGDTDWDRKAMTDKVTNRIQGLMLAVLDLAIKDKEMPEYGTEEKEMWREIVKVCTWALEGCKGKLPKGVEEKVKLVEGRLKEGSWSWILGLNAPIAASQKQWEEHKGWN